MSGIVSGLNADARWVYALENLCESTGLCGELYASAGKNVGIQYSVFSVRAIPVIVVPASTCKRAVT